MPLSLTLNTVSCKNANILSYDNLLHLGQTVIHRVCTGYHLVFNH